MTDLLACLLPHRDGGFTVSQLHQLAHKAGIKASAANNHLSTKRDLCLALALSSLHEFHQHIDAIMSAQSVSKPTQKAQITRASADNAKAAEDLKHLHGQVSKELAKTISLKTKVAVHVHIHAKGKKNWQNKQRSHVDRLETIQRKLAACQTQLQIDETLLREQKVDIDKLKAQAETSNDSLDLLKVEVQHLKEIDARLESALSLTNKYHARIHQAVQTTPRDKSFYADHLEKLKTTKQALTDSRTTVQQKLSELPDEHSAVQAYTNTLAAPNSNITKIADVLQLAKQTNAEVQTQMVKDEARETIESVKDDAVKLSDRVTELQHRIDSMSAQTHPDAVKSLIVDYENAKAQAEQQHSVLLETQRSLSGAHASAHDLDVRLSESVQNLMRDHDGLVTVTTQSLQKLNSISKKLEIPVSDDLSQIPSVIDAIDQKIAADINSRNEMEQTLHAYQRSFEDKVKEVETIAQTNVGKLQSKNKTLVAELQACQQKLASNREQVDKIASQIEGKDAHSQDLMDKMNALMKDKANLLNELNSCKKALEVNSLAQQATTIKGVVVNPISIDDQKEQKTSDSIAKIRDEISDHQQEQRQLAVEVQSMQEKEPSEKMHDTRERFDNLQKQINSKQDHVESLLHQQTISIKSQSDSLALQLEQKDDEIKRSRSDLAAREIAIQHDLTKAHEDIHREAQRNLDTMTSHISQMKADPRLQVDDDERRMLDDRGNMHTALISQEKALQDKLADIVAQKQRETASLEADYRRQMLEQEKIFQSSMADVNRQIAEDKLNTQSALHQKDLAALTQQQALSNSLETAGKAAINQVQQQYQGELQRLQAEYTQRLEECSSARQTLQEQANTSVQQLSLSNQDLERRLAVATDMQKQSEENMKSLVEQYHTLEGFAGEKNEQLQTLAQEYSGARDDFLRTQKLNAAFQGENAAAHQSLETYETDRQQLLAAMNELQFMVQREHQAAENATKIANQYGELIQQQAKTIADLKRVEFELRAAQQQIAALTDQMNKLEESRRLLERSCEEIHTSIQDLFEILRKSNLMGADMFRPIRGRKTVANSEMQAVHDIIHDYSHYRDEFEQVKGDLRDSILQQSLILNSHEHGMLKDTPSGQTEDETKKQLLEVIAHKETFAVQFEQRNDAAYTQMIKDINKIASDPSSIPFLKRKEELLTDFLNKAVLQPTDVIAETSSTAPDTNAARVNLSSMITKNSDLLSKTYQVEELFAENIPALNKVSTLSVEHEFINPLFQYNENISKTQDAAGSTLALLRHLPEWDAMKNLTLATLITQMGVTPSATATPPPPFQHTPVRNHNHVNLNIYQGDHQGYQGEYQGGNIYQGGEPQSTQTIQTKLIDVRAKMEELKDDGKSIIKMLGALRTGGGASKEKMLEIIGKQISEKERYMGDLAKVLIARGGGKGVKDLDVYQLTGIMKALNGVLIQNFKDLANYKASIRRQSEVEEKMLDMRDKLEKLMEYQEQLTEIARQSVDRALHLEEELMKHARTARNLRMFLLGMREGTSGDPVFSDKLNMFKYISPPDFDWARVIGAWDTSKLQTMSNWYLRVHNRLTSDAVKNAIDRAIRVFKEVEHADVLQNEAQRLDEMYNLQATIRQIIHHATLGDDLVHKFDDLKPLLDWAQTQVEPDEEPPDITLTGDVSGHSPTEPVDSASSIGEVWSMFQKLLKRHPTVLSDVNTPWLRSLLTDLTGEPVAGEASTQNAFTPARIADIVTMFQKLLQQHPDVLSDINTPWLRSLLTDLTGEQSRTVDGEASTQDVVNSQIEDIVRMFQKLLQQHPSVVSALDSPWLQTLLSHLTGEPSGAVAGEDSAEGAQVGGVLTEEAVNGPSNAAVPLVEEVVDQTAVSTISASQRQQLVDAFFGLPSPGESEDDSDAEASEVASVFDNLFKDWKAFIDRTIDKTRDIYHGVSSATKGKSSAPTYRPVQILIDETKGADLSEKKLLITAEMERLETLRFKKMVNTWKQRLMIDKLGDALGVIDLQLDHQKTIATLNNENKVCQTGKSEVQARLDDCTQQTGALNDKIADMLIKISEAQMRDDDYLAAFGVLIPEDTPMSTFEKSTDNNLPSNHSQLDVYRLDNDNSFPTETSSNENESDHVANDSQPDFQPAVSDDMSARGDPYRPESSQNDTVQPNLFADEAHRIPDANENIPVEVDNKPFIYSEFPQGNLFADENVPVELDPVESARVNPFAHGNPFVDEDVPVEVDSGPEIPADGLNTQFILQGDSFTPSQTESTTTLVPQTDYQEPTSPTSEVYTQAGGKMSFNPRTIDEFLLQWQSRGSQDFNNFLQSQKDATQKQSAICSKNFTKDKSKSRKIVIRRRTRRRH